MKDIVKIILALIIFLIIVLIAASVYHRHQENKKWERFNTGICIAYSLCD